MSDESTVDTQVATHAARPPRSFYIFGSLALVWNIIGVVFYVMQVTMTEETMAAMPEAERELMLAMPSWLIGVYALATNTGALGCLLLMLRKVWAVPLLIISLACIIGQMAYSLLATNAIEVLGVGVIFQSALIMLIGVILVWYSRKAADNGWIS